MSRALGSGGGGSLRELSEAKLLLSWESLEFENRGLTSKPSLQPRKCADRQNRLC